LPALIERVSQLVQERKSDSAIRRAVSAALGSKRVANLQIIKSGRHNVGDGIYIIAGNAAVTADGNGVVLAIGDCSLTARGTFQVGATDRAVLTLHDQVRAFASGDVEVRGSFGRVKGRAQGKVSGVARGQSEWVVAGNAHFDGVDGSALFGEGEARLRCYGDCKVRLRGRAFASLFGSTLGWFEEEASGEANGSSRAYTSTSAKVRQVGSEARVIPVEGSLPLSQRPWPVLYITEEAAQT
jgi:hypothetical protein